MKRIFLWGLALCVMLSGCVAKKPPQKIVVNKISVTMEQTTKVFTDHEDMIPILNAIRNRGQLTSPQIDPESLSVSVCRITLHRTDGSGLIYELKADRYIRRSGEPWREMNPRIYGEFIALLQEMTEP